MKPKVSVVYPVYTPRDELIQMTENNLLIAKSQTNIDAQWIIVETESKNFIDYADVFIYEKQKSTPNVSINRAFRCCQGEYVIFLANDVTVCDNWIEKMLECFETHSDCGLASLGNNEHQDPTDDVIIEEGTKFFFSVSMMNRKDAWLDPKYSRMFDDTDLIFRLYLQGKKHYKNLSGHVTHRKHSTYGEMCGDIDEYRRCRNIFKDKYKAHSDDPLYRLFLGAEV